MTWLYSPVRTGQGKVGKQWPLLALAYAFKSLDFVLAFVPCICKEFDCLEVLISKKSASRWCRVKPPRSKSTSHTENPRSCDRATQDSPDRKSIYQMHILVYSIYLLAFHWIYLLSTQTSTASNYGTCYQIWVATVSLVMIGQVDWLMKDTQRASSLD